MASDGFDIALDPPQLPVSVDPIPDESLISFIYRFALAAHVPSARLLAANCGFDKLRNRPRKEALARLASKTDVKIEKLESISFGEYHPAIARYRGKTISESMIQRRGRPDRRVCPDCLTESAHHRSIWDLIFVAICPAHLVRLVDTCDLCGDPLKWSGNDLARCHCRRDLRELPRIPVAEKDATGTKAVLGILGDERYRGECDRVRALPALGDLDDGEIVDFILRLGIELTGRLPKIFAIQDLGELAWQADTALNAGLAALDPWPIGYFNALDRIRERDSITNAAPIRRWLMPYTKWPKSLDNDRGKAIRAALAEYQAARESFTT